MGGGLHVSQRWWGSGGGAPARPPAAPQCGRAWRRWRAPCARWQSCGARSRWTSPCDPSEGLQTRGGWVQPAAQGGPAQRPVARRRCGDGAPAAAELCTHSRAPHGSINHLLCPHRVLLHSVLHLGRRLHRHRRPPRRQPAAQRERGAERGWDASCQDDTPIQQHGRPKERPAQPLWVAHLCGRPAGSRCAARKQLELASHCWVTDGCAARAKTVVARWGTTAATLRDAIRCVCEKLTLGRLPDRDGGRRAAALSKKI